MELIEETRKICVSRKDKIYSFLDFKRSFNIRNRGSDVVWAVFILWADFILTNPKWRSINWWLLTLTKEILVISDSFRKFNTNAILIIPSQNIYHILNPYVTQELLCPFMFDIITIGTSARLSLPDTISNGTLGCKRKWIKRACPHYEEIDAAWLR